MRVKLSYTVEQEDILPEAAKILGLSSDDMKHAIDMFQAIQNELTGDEESAPNTMKALEMIEDFRKALLAVDTRLQEITEIIDGYDDLRRGKLTPPSAATPVADAHEPELFGAD
mgnify:CR=1 FL=1|tara:strand:+ start:431 stop:772 length:342 start_codon:yes stop_codon:yes gene_type:complete